MDINLRITDMAGAGPILPTGNRRRLDSGLEKEGD